MNHSLLLKRVFAPSGPQRVRADREAIWPIAHRRWAWLSLGLSCSAYLLLSLAHHQAFYPWGRLNFFDLKVYRGAARLALDSRPLYGGPIWRWAPFTYPPFAAIVLAPLGLLTLALDKVLVTGLGIAALFALLSLALRLSPGHEPKAEVDGLPLMPVAVAAALWLEPITATLAYGQINLLIALLVVGDLSRPDDAPGKGALVGLAAGLKLTPLIFVPYLLFSRRPRVPRLADSLRRSRRDTPSSPVTRGGSGVARCFSIPTA